MSRSTMLLGAIALAMSSSLAMAQSLHTTQGPRAATKTWPNAGTPAANARSQRAREPGEAATTGASGQASPGLTRPNKPRRDQR